MPESSDPVHHPFQPEIDELVACVLEDRETSTSVFDAQKTIENLPRGGSVGGIRRAAGPAASYRRLRGCHDSHDVHGVTFSRPLPPRRRRRLCSERRRRHHSRTVPPNERIRFAAIGLGIRGQQDVRAALRTPGVELAAVADVYDGRLALAKELWGSQVFTTRDYRETLARPDIDAVVIATPDHWHRQIAIEAMNAGKDVYVEKPMVQELDEGQLVIDAARKTGRILQVGSQRVSSIVYIKARELFRAGAVGELNLVEAWINRNSPTGAWQYSIPPDASPQTIDWDGFLGRAPKCPFEPVRLFRWRNYRDYGTGIPGDLFVHLFTGIHFVLDSLGPTRAIAMGGLRYWHDGRDVPDVMLALYDYPKTSSHPAFTLSLKVNFAEGSGNDQAFRFVGPEGVLTITRTRSRSRAGRPRRSRARRQTRSRNRCRRLSSRSTARSTETGRSCGLATTRSTRRRLGYSADEDHFRNFFDAVRSRRPVVEDAVFGMRAAGPALLANYSYFESRPMGGTPRR